MRGFIKLIIAGSIILGIGIAILVISLGVNNWQIDGDYEMQSYECAENNSTLDIDFSAGTLEINYYEGEKIKIEYPENEMWSASISESNGALSFATENKRKWNNFSGWFMKLPTTKIWIPQGDIMDVKLDMNAGTVKFFGGEYGDFNIVMNAGTISTDDMVCKKLSIEMSAGTVNLKSVESEQDVVIELSAGTINVQSLVCPSLECDLSAGTANIHKLQSSSVDVDVSAGSVKLGMVGAKSDYNIAVDKSAGSCNISNQKGATDRRIKAEISAGSLAVNFES